MGKIRIRTLGDEKQEKQEKKKAKLRVEVKKTITTESVEKSPISQEAANAEATLSD